MADLTIEPLEVARIVEDYVDDQHRDVEKFVNRELLDDSGVYDLHTLAGRIYALGFRDGTAAEGWRQAASSRRERAAARRAAEPDGFGSTPEGDASDTPSDLDVH